MSAPAEVAEVTARLGVLAGRVGLRVLVVPADEPPMHFGTSVRTGLGVPAVPGALAMTWIETEDSAEEGEVEQRGAEVVEAMAAEPGFIGFVGTNAAGRGHTFTAWTSPGAAERAVAGNRPHAEARRRFLHGTLGRRGFTSLWVPHRLNPQHVRCPDCGDRHAIRPGNEAPRCHCGAALGLAPYF
ncbi:hypothetical protein [Actinomycetospora cinnamomea]|uniref:Uncharacterized protein n=1 Tax=Actinomycetospora cinnamomea TaxID=663609 RepID=A0A2U1EYL7_9PSEU|nr:hypothetical protein [Actinomycetospora cinnamomea]PVZ05002.1 hypothetical protein C8D89_116109 [Actinomycetospora cinnamomea]